MDDKNDPLPEDEFDSFEAFEDMDALPEENAGLDMADDVDPAEDADFQDLDMADDLDADVFADPEGDPVTPKKKTNWFNIGVAVVAIVVAGGLVLSKLGPQLMGGDDATPVAAINTPVGESPAQQSMDAAQQAVQGQGTGTTGGLLDNPEQFAALDTTPTAPMVPETDDTFGGIDDPFAALSSVQKAPAAAEPVLDSVPMPAPISQEPVAAAPMDSEPQLENEPDLITARAPAQSAPPSQVDQMPVPDMTGDVSGGLAEKVDTLENRLDSLDAKITTALDRLEKSGGAVVNASADDSRLDAIQSALERLETRIDKISKTQMGGATQVASSPTPVKSAPKETSKKTASVPKKPTKSKPSSQWDAPYKPSNAQSVSTTASSASGGWQLRGAQPGRAIIAARSGDIREVGVGDNVPGLGEITGVATINGLWVVQGTQGRLSQ